MNILEWASNKTMLWHGDERPKRKCADSEQLKGVIVSTKVLHGVLLYSCIVYSV